MTRQEAKDESWSNFIEFKNKKSLKQYYNSIDKIFDDFEQELQIASSDKTCDGCVNKPLPNENYPEVCGTCSRWYSDNYEEIKND